MENLESCGIQKLNPQEITDIDGGKLLPTGPTTIGLEITHVLLDFARGFLDRFTLYTK